MYLHAPCGVVLYIVVFNSMPIKKKYSSRNRTVCIVFFVLISYFMYICPYLLLINDNSNLVLL